MGKKLSIYENDVDKAWYDSSTVLYSECDDKENELKTVRVVFKNGTMYAYKEVKVNDYLLFRESSSQGKAVHKILKQYECEKLENANLSLINENFEKTLKRLEKEQNKKKTFVISAFPGCGKTTAFNKIKNEYNVVDMESSFFDKSNFPTNYISSLKEYIGVADIVFVSTHEKVRQMLHNENIEYFLFYPNDNRKDEMISLYQQRGSEEIFIDLMNQHFEHFLQSIKDDKYAAQKICLEYEGDFILNNNIFQLMLKEVEKN